MEKDSLLMFVMVVSIILVVLVIGMEIIRFKHKKEIEKHYRRRGDKPPSHPNCKCITEERLTGGGYKDE